MKGIKLVFCILATILSVAFGATYHAASTPLNPAGTVQAAIDALSPGPVAGTSLAVPKLDGSGWEVKQCSSKTDIKAALEKDTTEETNVIDGAKKGSCCINAHHEACILLQDQIRSCGHTGKGDNSVTTDASLCPQ